MKKLIALLLAVVMVMGLAACGKTDAPEQAETPTASAAAPEAEAAPEALPEGVISTAEAKLKVFLPVTAPDRLTIAEEWFVNYKEAFPNFEVEFDLQTSSYSDKMKIYCSGGDMPDVFWCLNDTPVLTGDCMDLTDKIQESGFMDKLKNTASQIPYTDGKIYAISCGQDSYYIPTIWYNTAIFEAAGVTIPTTYDEFLDVCQKLKDYGVTPIAMPAGMINELHLETFMNANDPGSMREIVSGNASWTDANTVAGVQKLEEIVTKGYVPSDIATLSWDGACELFNAEQVAMWFEPTWGYGSITLDPANVDFFVMPTVDGTKAIGGWGSFAGGYSVAADTEYPEEALMFAEWMVSQDAEYFEQVSNATVAYETGLAVPEAPVALQKNNELINSGEYTLIPNSSTLWGADARAELSTQLGKLLSQQITAEEFCQAMAAVCQ